jgi:spermidine synthase
MPERDLMPGWSVELLHDDFRQCLKEATLLYDSETGRQRLRVFRNPTFGRILTLDGVVQVTEGDEFIYHEMMAHVPILSHGAARSVLIVGGGDGGMAREVLKHPGVARVVMVEIDESVIAFSKRYLPGIGAGAFDDPRLEVVIADGADYVRDAAETFDVAIVDSTDPIGPGVTLYTDSFYGRAKARLNPGGIMVTQNGVPFMQGHELTNTLRAFGALFADATCYLTQIPTYVCGPMAMGWGTDGEARLTPLDVLEARFAAAGFATRYYTPEVHKAAFALPVYVKKLFP